MVRYIGRRLLNYAVLLFVAISLTFVLAATQLNPRALFQLRQPPIEPAIIEQQLLKYNLSDTVPLAAAVLDLADRDLPRRLGILPARASTSPSRSAPGCG